MLGKQGENVGNPSIFWQQGRTHCLQFANPKKKVFKSWGNLWSFSKSSFGGVFVGNVYFLWQTGEFSKKKEKLVMIFTNL
jgi:hypothetical protein